MKKVFILVLSLTMILGLVSCNLNIGFGNYDWTHVHFSDAIEGHCATISSWHDDPTGIEVHTKECGSMFLSEGSYMLFEDESKCPYCKGQ